MKPYSITTTANINDLPNEDGNYSYTIMKVDDTDIEPVTIWAVSFNEARDIFIKTFLK
jgi:hypothetical protein